MKMHILKSNKGFTLIEALTAMVVLTVGILALYTMQTSAIRGNAHGSRITTASTWNARQIERMIGMQYLDATLVDSDGDGTNADGNGDGVDDNGAQFGLDDATAASADGSFNSPDGRYVLYWNVAVDVPVVNSKTIRIHVQDNLQLLSKPVTFTYIKANII